MQYKDDGFKTFANDSANSVSLEAHRRVKLDANNNLAYAGIEDVGLGTMETKTTATDTSGTVRLWNHPGTRPFIAAGAISAMAYGYAAANGKIAATGTKKICIVLDASTADGDVIECLPLVELTSSFSVNTTAGAVSAAGTAEAAFDITSQIPASELKAGDVIDFQLYVKVANQNSTDTLLVGLRIGGLTGTLIAATAALDVGTGDFAMIKGSIVFRTVGAGGTFIAFGDQCIGPAATTLKSFDKASTAIDTTSAAALILTPTYTWSVSNANNQARVDALIWRKRAA